MTLWAQGFGFHDGPVTCLDLHVTEHAAVTGSEDGGGKLVNLASGKARVARRLCSLPAPCLLCRRRV